MAITSAPVLRDAPAPPRYRRVLLVEDDATLRATLRANLERRGVAVDEASTVSEALAICGRQLPDLLILDINLPDGSGWHVLGALQASSDQPPTIVISASRITRQRLTEFRVAAYMPKPFAINSLIEFVTGKAVPSR